MAGTVTTQQFSEKDITEEIHHLFEDSYETYLENSELVETDSRVARHMGRPGPHWHLIEINPEDCSDLRLVALQQMANEGLILFTTTSNEPEDIKQIEKGFRGFAYFSKESGQEVFANMYFQSNAEAA